MGLIRKNKKEYDGPANNTTAIEVQTSAAMQALAMKDKKYESTSNNDVGRRRSSSSGDQVSKQQRRTSESSSSNSNNKQQQPLASGISSRRSSTKVQNHLPAHMMTSPIIEEGTNLGKQQSKTKNRGLLRGAESDIPTNLISFDTNNDNVSVISGTQSIMTSNIKSRNQQPQSQHTQSSQHIQSSQPNKRREIKPQLPMEHDGGVLCICGVPSISINKFNEVEESIERFRFLSGGADGQVKLWEVVETPDKKLNPRLLKTYIGHSGYVHSIAILGTAYDPTTLLNNSLTENNNGSSLLGAMGGAWARSDPTSRRGSNFMKSTSIGEDTTDTQSQTSRGSRGSGNGDYYNDSPRSASKRSIQLPHRSKRRSSQSSLGSCSSGDRGLQQRHSQQPRKRLFFVSASRDNTLRIWPIDDHTNSSHQHHGNKEGMFDRSATSILDDSSDRSNEGQQLQQNNREDPLSKGIKLRGHQFGKNNIGGVLCVCAVPSLAPEENDFVEDHHHGRSSNSLNFLDHSGKSSGDEDNNITSSSRLSRRTSAGQFASGGCDGCIRIWDVKSALNLTNIKKLPKSVKEAKGKRLQELQCEGMYATVQLQCIKPPAAPGGSLSSSSSKNKISTTNENRFPAAITSLVCTHRGKSHHMNDGGGIIPSDVDASMFAGDASGTIRRYSRMNECGSGHQNGAIWWGCTGIFAGHSMSITSMSMLISCKLMPLLCPNVDVDDAETGIMLVSSSDDGSVRVWDAFDTRIKHQGGGVSSVDASDRSDDEYVITASGRIPKRKAMWEIELNEGSGGEDSSLSTTNYRHPSTASVNASTSNRGGRIGVTSLSILHSGTLMAAATTDGAIRMWNVSSGMYEGAYNLGRNVQIWSLDTISEELDRNDNDDSSDSGNEDDTHFLSKMIEDKRNKVGIIASGDNRGRIRVLRKNV